MSGIISIRAKPAFLSHGFYSSSIQKRRIPSSLCVAASSLTQMHSRRRQHVASNSAIILRASCSLSGKIIFSKKQIKNRVWNSRSPVCPCCSGFPWGFPHGCLLHSKSPGNAGSRGAPPISVSSALALSFVALSIGGVWSMTFYGALQPPNVFPSCYSDWGRGILLVLLQALVFFG